LSIIKNKIMSQTKIYKHNLEFLEVFKKQATPFDKTLIKNKPKTTNKNVKSK